MREKMEQLLEAARPARSDPPSLTPLQVSSPLLAQNLQTLAYESTSFGGDDSGAGDNDNQYDGKGIGVDGTDYNLPQKPAHGISSSASPSATHPLTPPQDATTQQNQLELASKNFEIYHELPPCSVAIDQVASTPSGVEAFGMRTSNAPPNDVVESLPAVQYSCAEEEHALRAQLPPLVPMQPVPTNSLDAAHTLASTAASSILIPELKLRIVPRGEKAQAKELEHKKKIEQVTTLDQHRSDSPVRSRAAATKWELASVNEMTWEFCINYKAVNETWLPLTELAQLATGAKDYTLRPTISKVSHLPSPQATTPLSAHSVAVVPRFWTALLLRLRELLAENTPKAKPLDSKERLSDISKALDNAIDEARYMTADEFQDAFNVAATLLSFSAKYFKEPPALSFYAPIFRCCRVIERIWTLVEASKQAISSQQQLYSLLANHCIVSIIFKVLGRFKRMMVAGSKANLKAFDVDSVVELVVKLLDFQAAKFVASPTQSETNRSQMLRMLLVPIDATDNWPAQLWERLLAPPVRQGSITKGRQYWSDGAYNEEDVPRLALERTIERVFRFIDTPVVDSIFLNETDSQFSLTKVFTKALISVVRDNPTSLFRHLSQIDPPVGAIIWNSLIGDDQWDDYQVWLKLAGCLVRSQPLMMENDMIFHQLLVGVLKIDLADASKPIEALLEFVDLLLSNICDRHRSGDTSADAESLEESPCDAAVTEELSSRCFSVETEEDVVAVRKFATSSSVGEKTVRLPYGRPVLTMCRTRICLLLCQLLRFIDERGNISRLKTTFTDGTRLEDFCTSDSIAALSRLPAALSTEHVRMTDLIKSGYDVVARTLLRLLRSMVTGGEDAVALEQSLKVMLQLVEEGLASMDRDAQLVFLCAMHQTELLETLLETFDMARSACRGLQSRPDFHGLLLKCGLRMACIVASTSMQGDTHRSLVRPEMRAHHLIAALRDSRTLLNFLQTDMQREAEFEHFLHEIFEALAGDEQTVNEARRALVLSMLNVKNKALLRCLGFLTRSVHTLRGSAIAHKYVQMKLLLVSPNVFKGILHLIAAPQLDTKVRVAVALLMLRLVRLPAGLHDALAEAYDADDVGKNHGFGDAGFSSSTNRSLFSSDAAEVHGRGEWMDRALDLAADLQSAALKIESIENTRDAPPEGVKLLKNGMSLSELRRLDHVSQSGLHLLLEGGTGVGKSATVESTAKLQDTPKKLVRYNLSRNTTIDELIGQVKMEATASGEVEFRLQLQPFTTAFRDGHWLLLDEMNLAQDTVLQCIEQALDSGVLEVPDHTSSNVSSLVIEMHKEFRLFGTQNPNAGLFKGKREQLSQSFLGRFLPVTFTEYPDADWKEILQQRLAPGFKFEAESVAEKLAAFRSGFVSNKGTEFKRAYAIVSIRQLIEVVQHLLHDQQRLNHVLKTEQSEHFYARVGFEVWCTFCGRFRETPRTACMEIEALLQQILTLSNSSLARCLPYEDAATVLRFEKVRSGEMRLSLGHHVILQRRPDYMAEALDGIPEEPCGLIIQTHQQVTEVLLQNAATWGVVIGCSSWWREWVQLFTCKGLGPDPSGWKSLMLEGCVIFAGSLRHDVARQKVVDIFHKITAQHNSRRLRYVMDDIADSKLTARVHSDLKSRKRVPRVPIALTTRFRRALTQLGRAVRVQLPTLITGPTSSGKTTLVLVLAELCQVPLRQVYMTAETEASLLVGSMRPVKSGIEWEHGIITQCVEAGMWALLDNLAEADSCVLERLNPCLESKVDWRLTERGQDGDEDSMAVDPEFRFVATMTTGGRGQQHELSPALYNRFTIVHLDAITKASSEPLERRSGAFKAEMELMVECVLPFKTPGSNLPTLLWELWLRFEKHEQQSRLAQPLNLRSVVRFLDSAYRLSIELSKVSVDTLVLAFEATMSGMFKAEQDATLELSWFCEQLQVSRADVLRPCVELGATSSVVITQSRKIYAEQLYYADVCDLPVLLEGPAAVGKTALVQALCSKVNDGKLYRVNNTQTTTIEDYLGSQMPTGGGFEYQDGELIKAMKTGGWFLADEFNLADPNIMSMLSPLLEGQGSLRLEGEHEPVRTHPRFRFFATQNDSNYAGRNKLPPTLRARFLEMQVHTFEMEDILEIWQSRIRAGSTLLKNAQAQLIAEVYSALRSNGSPQVSLTMREIEKWCSSKSGRFGLFKRHAPQALPNDLLYCAGLSLLLPRFVERSVDHDSILRTFASVFDNAGIVTAPENGFSGRLNVVVHKQKQKYLEQNIAHFVRQQRGGNLAELSPQLQLKVERMTESLTLQRCLSQLLLATECKEPVLLVGPTAYKSYVLQLWAELRCNEEKSSRLNSDEILSIAYLSPDSEASDLLGQLSPYSLELLVENLLTLASDLREIVGKLLCGTSWGPDFSRFKGLVDELASNVTAMKSRAANVAAANGKTRDEDDDGEDEIPPPSAFPMADLTANLSDRPASAFEEEELVDYGTDGEEDFEGRSYACWSIPIVGHAIEPITPTSIDLGKTADDIVKAQGCEDSGNDWTSSDSSGNDSTDEDEAPSDVLPKIKELQLAARNAGPAISKEAAELKRAQRQCMETLGKLLEKEHPNDLTPVNVLLKRVDLERSERIKTRCGQIAKKMQRLWSAIARKPPDKLDEPIFCFRDGPLTNCIINGGAIVLEDFDLPNQAVTERLNSLFEPDRSFALQEDISRDVMGDKHTNSIPIPDSFQVFATVNSQPGEALKISPATRSRFTEIQCPAYGRDEVELIVKLTLQDNGLKEKSSHVVAALLLQLHDAVESLATRGAISILPLFKICEFVSSQLASAGELENTDEKRLKRETLKGARFLMLDSLPVKDMERIGWQFLSEDQDFFLAIFREPQRRQRDDEPPPLAKKTAASGAGLLVSTFGDISTVISSDLANRESIGKLAGLHATPAVVKNVARTLASREAKSPMLLNGPPGVGKTAVVGAVAASLGIEVERINLSANTSVEQLFGSIMPTMTEAGQRVFAWHDGTLLAAMRQDVPKWILLDEINLAPMEVLECLAPLLRPSIESFSVPGCTTTLRFTDWGKAVDSSRQISSEDLLVARPTIFATMNPASIGGGRTRLPRSIQNLFTNVCLEEFSSKDLAEIFESQLRGRGLLQTKTSGPRIITKSLARSALQLHNAIRTLVSERKVGRGGGPFDFNLRDLTKVIDLLSGNAANLTEHYQQSSVGDDLASDVGTQVLAKIMNVVYAGRFQTPEDQEEVRHLIEDDPRFLHVSGLNQTAATQIDSSVPGILQIGAIFMKVDSSGQSRSALVSTPRTVMTLEVLAAAVQSNPARSVLLEGETCSAKTAVVLELARLCDKKITLLPMTHEIETSDLLGQWLPSKASAVSNDISRGFDIMRKAANQLIAMVHPLLVKESVERQGVSNGTGDEETQASFSTQLRRAVEDILCKLVPILETRELLSDATHDPDAGEAEEIASLLEDISDTIDLIQQHPSCQERGIPVILQPLRSESAEFAPTLRALTNHAAAASKTAFQFVKSPLVKAAEEGEWVLLDNVNSAPPEVIERLNSLFETPPTLSLLEAGQSDLAIHPNFRIFTTANMKRAGSHKLSAAFLNRVIRIWLPAMDGDVVAKASIRTPEGDLGKLEDENLLKTEAFQIVRARLESEPRFRAHANGYASLIVLFHAQAKLNVIHKRMALAAGVDLSFRFMLNVLRAAQSLVERPKMTTASAIAMAIKHVYIDSISDSSDVSERKAQQLYILIGLMRQTRYLMVDAAELVPRPSLMRAAQPWKQDEQVFGKRVAVLESALLELLQIEREKLPNDKFVALSYRIIDQQAMRLYLELDSADNYEKAIKRIAAIDTISIPSKSSKGKVLKLLQLYSTASVNTSIGNRLRDAQRQAKSAAEVFVNGASVADAAFRLRTLQRVQSICNGFLELLSPSIWTSDGVESANVKAQDLWASIAFARTLLSEQLVQAKKHGEQLQMLTLPHKTLRPVKDALEKNKLTHLLSELLGIISQPLASAMQLGEKMEVIIQRLSIDSGVSSAGEEARTQLQVGVKRLAIVMHWLSDSQRGLAALSQIQVVAGTIRLNANGALEYSLPAFEEDKFYTCIVLIKNERMQPASFTITIGEKSYIVEVSSKPWLKSNVCPIDQRRTAGQHGPRVEVKATVGGLEVMGTPLQPGPCDSKQTLKVLRAEEKRMALATIVEKLRPSLNPGAFAGVQFKQSLDTRLESLRVLDADAQAKRATWKDVQKKVEKAQEKSVQHAQSQEMAAADCTDELESLIPEPSLPIEPADDTPGPLTSASSTVSLNSEELKSIAARPHRPSIGAAESAYKHAIQSEIDAHNELLRAEEKLKQEQEDLECWINERRINALDCFAEAGQVDSLGQSAWDLLTAGRDDAVLDECQSILAAWNHLSVSVKTKFSSLESLKELQNAPPSRLRSRLLALSQDTLNHDLFKVVSALIFIDVPPQKQLIKSARASITKVHEVTSSRHARQAVEIDSSTKISFLFEPIVDQQHAWHAAIMEHVEWFELAIAAVSKFKEPPNDARFEGIAPPEHFRRLSTVESDCREEVTGVSVSMSVVIVHDEGAHQRHVLHLLPDGINSRTLRKHRGYAKQVCGLPTAMFAEPLVFHEDFCCVGADVLTGMVFATIWCERAVLDSGQHSSHPCQIAIRRGAEVRGKERWNDFEADVDSCKPDSFQALKVSLCQRLQKLGSSIASPDYKLRTLLTDVYHALIAWKEQNHAWKENAYSVARQLHNVNVTLQGHMLSRGDVVEGVKLCIQRCNASELLIDELRRLGGIKVIFPLTSDVILGELGLRAESKVLSSMLQLHTMLRKTLRFVAHWVPEKVSVRSAADVEELYTSRKTTAGRKGEATREITAKASLVELARWPSSGVLDSKTRDMKQDMFEAIIAELDITPKALRDNMLEPGMFRSLQLEDAFEVASLQSADHVDKKTHETFDARRMMLRRRLEVQLKILMGLRAPPRYLVNAVQWKLSDLERENPDVDWLIAELKEVNTLIEKIQEFQANAFNEDPVLAQTKDSTRKVVTSVRTAFERITEMWDKKGMPDRVRGIRKVDRGDADQVKSLLDSVGQASLEFDDVQHLEHYCSRLDKDVALGELHGILSRCDGDTLEECLEVSHAKSPAFVKLDENLSRITLALGDEALRKCLSELRTKAAMGVLRECDAEPLRSTAVRSTVAVRTDLLLHANTADRSSGILVNMRLSDRLFGLVHASGVSHADQTNNRFLHAAKSATLFQSHDVYSMIYGRFAALMSHMQGTELTFRPRLLGLSLTDLFVLIMPCHELIKFAIELHHGTTAALSTSAHDRESASKSALNKSNLTKVELFKQLIDDHNLGNFAAAGKASFINDLSDPNSPEHKLSEAACQGLCKVMGTAVEAGFELTQLAMLGVSGQSHLSREAAGGERAERDEYNPRSVRALGMVASLDEWLPFQLAMALLIFDAAVDASWHVFSNMLERREQRAETRRRYETRPIRSLLQVYKELCASLDDAFGRHSVRERRVVDLFLDLTAKDAHAVSSKLARASRRFDELLREFQQVLNEKRKQAMEYGKSHPFTQLENFSKILELVATVISSTCGTTKDAPICTFVEMGRSLLQTAYGRNTSRPLWEKVGELDRIVTALLGSSSSLLQYRNAVWTNDADEKVQMAIFFEQLAAFDEAFEKMEEQEQKVKRMTHKAFALDVDAKGRFETSLMQMCAATRTLAIHAKLVAVEHARNRSKITASDQMTKASLIVHAQARQTGNEHLLLDDSLMRPRRPGATAAMASSGLDDSLAAQLEQFKKTLPSACLASRSIFGMGSSLYEIMSALAHAIAAIEPGQVDAAYIAHHVLHSSLRPLLLPPGVEHTHALPGALGVVQIMCDHAETMRFCQSIDVNNESVKSDDLVAQHVAQVQQTCALLQNIFTWFEQSITILRHLGEPQLSVEIIGLLEREELNGRTATVVTYDAPSGSYLISVEPSEQILLQPEKLLSLDKIGSGGEAAANALETGSKALDALTREILCNSCRVVRRHLVDKALHASSSAHLNEGNLISVSEGVVKLDCSKFRLVDLLAQSADHDTSQRPSGSFNVAINHYPLLAQSIRREAEDKNCQPSGLLEQLVAPCQLSQLLLAGAVDAAESVMLLLEQDVDAQASCQLLDMYHAHSTSTVNELMNSVEEALLRNDLDLEAIGQVAPVKVLEAALGLRSRFDEIILASQHKRAGNKLESRTKLGPLIDSFSSGRELAKKFESVEKVHTEELYREQRCWYENLLMDLKDKHE
ncbi:MAG: hypothetical protein SGPRY_000294, partial [Prymnesium sp.]